MSVFIESYTWENDKSIVFLLSNNVKHVYRFRILNNLSIYLSNRTGPNNALFTSLGIEDPYAWSQKIVGYRLNNGGWPEVKSKGDLMKVIDALLKYNNPKYAIKQDFIVEDDPILPSEVIPFYKADTREVTFKELNVDYYLYEVAKKVWWAPKYNTTTKSEIKESYIFTQLKIKDKNKWVENIQGYTPPGGLGENDFPESKTKEDAYKVMDALIAEYIKQFKLKTKVNYGDSKIELRRKKIDVRVGSCPAGSIVYGKRSKTAVRSRRVSYQTCIGS